ncbi:hypothetical protein EST38_g10063 [Candolleomyces aberdarensis]|uniref:G domain-containing protein n=1 Tax=Candolleomyces aberdarensis TaxID=2316362 RepID=A0A4Q2DAR6_9AGAR|nr:hypothetical protein EST38_g10063 [Candolleomyces aberdarensis]
MPRKKQNIRKLRGPNDAVVQQARSDDILIPVMGPTGVGKSTVCIVSRSACKTGSSQLAPSSDGFASCTTTMADYRIQVPDDVATRFPFTRGRHLVLVDTPGFDNVTVSDTEILRRLAVWLASAYDADMKKICGKEGLSKIILATTRWDSCPEQTGPNREKEVWDSFWDGCSRTPSQAESMARLENSPESAWKAISAILERMEDSGVVLALQEQLVDTGKSLQQTDAAKELRAKILHMLRDSSTDGSQSRKKRLEDLSKEAKDLKIPLSKKIQGLFGIYG